MKTLYLVRHAKSSWDLPELKDTERPLLEKGIVKTKKVIKFLKEKKVRVDLMISSPAIRAYETAKLIARGLDYPLEKIVTDRKLYEGNVDDILDVIYTTDKNIDSLMLFGHNPNFSMLADMFLHIGDDFLPTSGVACISFPAEKWEKISEVKAKKEFLLFPGKI
jgi:phosphohistidine phosphatase